MVFTRSKPKAELEVTAQATDHSYNFRNPVVSSNRHVIDNAK